MSMAMIQRAFRLYVKVLRLSTFCAVAGVVVAVLVARSVYGSAAESVFELDRQWARQSGTMDRGSYRVRLNGQAMSISSHMTDASMHAVLEAADDECRAHAGEIEGAVAKLPGLAVSKLTSLVFGVVHREWKDGGYVACIERDGDRGLGELASDLRELAKTGDLARLGTFRYVIADRGPGATKTHVLRQWTEGEFNLTKMFPSEGDVPGSDLAEVPRPSAARRILDANVDQSPFGVRVYDAAGTPASILASYDHDLMAKGWTSVALPEKDAATMRVYDQGAADLFISASRNGERTVVSIADLPPGSAVPAAH
jgi:hypothetical protein